MTLVHVVVGGVADQAVDAVLRLGRHIADWHHLFRRRLIVAADMALTAALAAQLDPTLGALLRPALNQGGPTGPGEAARNPAGAVDLADGDLVRPAVDPSPVIAIGGKAARTALKLEMDRVDDVVERVDVRNGPIGVLHLNGGMAAQTGLWTLIAADAGFPEIFDMRRPGIADEGCRVHQHLDLDLAREGILRAVDDCRRLAVTGILAERPGQQFEIRVGHGLTVRVGQRCVDLTDIGFKNAWIDDLIGEGREERNDHRDEQDALVFQGRPDVCEWAHSHHPWEIPTRRRRRNVAPRPTAYPGFCSWRASRCQPVSIARMLVHRVSPVLMI